MSCAARRVSRDARIVFIGTAALNVCATLLCVAAVGKSEGNWTCPLPIFPPAGRSSAPH